MSKLDRDQRGLDQLEGFYLSLEVMTVSCIPWGLASAYTVPA